MADNIATHTHTALSLCFKTKNIAMQHHYSPEALSQQQQELPFSSLSSPKEEKPISTQEEKQETMAEAPDRKVICSLHDSEANFVENRELGIVSYVDQDQEMFDSVTENVIASDVGIGFSDRNHERSGQETKHVPIRVVDFVSNDVKKGGETFSDRVHGELTDSEKETIDLEESEVVLMRKESEIPTLEVGRISESKINGGKVADSASFLRIEEKWNGCSKMVPPSNGEKLHFPIRVPLEGVMSHMGYLFSDRKDESFGKETPNSFVDFASKDVREVVFSSLVGKEDTTTDRPNGELTQSEKNIEQVEEVKSFLEVERCSAVKSEENETTVFEENKDVQMGKDKESEIPRFEVGRLSECEHVEKEKGCLEKPKIAQSNGQKLDLPVRLPVKFEVIDDTALIETIPIQKPVKPKNGEISGSAKTRQRTQKILPKREVDRNVRVKLPRRKERGKDVKMVMEVQYNGKKNGGQSKKMYLREELESLRYAKIVEQQILWKNIYACLGPVVSREYSELACSKNQKIIRLNSDPRERFAQRKQEVPVMLGVVAAL